MSTTSNPTTVASLSDTFRSLCIDEIGMKYNCLDLHNITVFKENGIEGIQMKAFGRTYKVVFYQQNVSVFRINCRHRARPLQNTKAILSRLIEEARGIVETIREAVEAPVEEEVGEGIFSCLLSY